MNNRYKIKVEDPLLRPGLSIETEVSEKYLVAGVQKIMNMVREINNPPVHNHRVPDLDYTIVDHGFTIDWKPKNG